MPNDLQLLQKGITSYVDDAIRTAPYTEIVTGWIIQDMTIFSQGYTVMINGKQYTNVPRQGSEKYENGTTVKIAIPNGQYNNMFIMGRVKMGDEGQRFGTVNSVNGMTGVVVLDKGDLGLANVDNTSDANKNVLSATKLTTARTISLSGDVTGSVSFDGSANVSITSTVADDSHNHIISNVDNLQPTLDLKAPLSSPSFTGIPLAPTATSGTNTTQIATTAFVKTAIEAIGISSITWNE